MDFESLPPEILMIIFSYLWTTDLIRAGKVCGNWASVAKITSLWRYRHLQFPRDGDQETRFELIKGAPLLEAFDYNGGLSSDDGASHHIRLIDTLSSHCKNLIDVTLHWCEITSKTLLLTLAMNCKRLQYIDLTWSGFNKGSMSKYFLPLSECKNLIYLDLAYCRSLHLKEFTAICKNCVKIQYLNIIETGRMHTGDSIVPVAEYLRDLRHLSLSGCHFRSNDASLATLSKCKHLHTLNLDAFGMSYVGGLSSLNQLSTLTLRNSHNAQSVTGLTGFREIFSNKTNLQTLLFWGCYELCNFSAISSIANGCPNLRYLGFFKNVGFKPESVFSYLTNKCKSLALIDNISDSDVKEFASPKNIGLNIIQNPTEKEIRDKIISIICNFERKSRYCTKNY